MARTRQGSTTARKRLLMLKRRQRWRREHTVPHLLRLGRRGIMNRRSMSDRYHTTTTAGDGLPWGGRNIGTTTSTFTAALCPCGIAIFAADNLVACSCPHLPHCQLRARVLIGLASQSQVMTTIRRTQVPKNADCEGLQQVYHQQQQATPSEPGFGLSLRQLYADGNSFHP